MQLGRDGRVYMRVGPDAIHLGGHSVTGFEGTVRL
jgi:hypothetical protein